MTNGKNAKRQRQKEGRKARLEQEMKAQRARKRRRSAVLMVLLLAAVAFFLYQSQPSGEDQPAASASATPSTSAAGETPPTDAGFATFVTSMGDIKVRLFPEKSPKTVANFVGLATGTKEWTDPRTGQTTTEPLYENTIFHRVIPNFMIQGGDPLGTGTGGPGYQFEDEVDNGLGFERPGLLAMANSGPDTNGSQFFITVSTPTHLNGRHTIFGEVVSGQEVVDAISKVPTDADKPVTDVVLKEVKITAE